MDEEDVDESFDLTDNIAPEWRRLQAQSDLLNRVIAAVEEDKKHAQAANFSNLPLKSRKIND